MPNVEARRNDETYTPDLLRILICGVISSFVIRALSLCLRINRSHSRCVRFDCRSTGWTTAEAPGGKIRSDYEHGGDELRNERFNSWKNSEPESHPCRDVCVKKTDWRSGNPMRQLHFLCLLTNHDKQHHSQQHPRGNYHFSIR